jgi:hypothetical protein
MAQRTSMRERIAARVAALAANDEPGEVSLGWRALSPNVWVKLLRHDFHSQTQTTLFRVLPGGVVPARSHTQDEACLVLEGEVFIGEHRIGQGDLHLAGPDTRQRDITTRTGAMLMVRSEPSSCRSNPQRAAG